MWTLGPCGPISLWNMSFNYSHLGFRSLLQVLEPLLKTVMWVGFLWVGFLWVRFLWVGSSGSLSSLADGSQVPVELLFFFCEEILTFLQVIQFTF